VRAKSAVLTDEMVLSGSIGRTRPVKNVFQLWKQIFVSNNTKKPGAKKPAGGGGAAAGKARPLAEDQQQELVKDLQHSDSQRVMDGVAEHYLSVPFTDPQMVHAADAAEWLSHHDLLQHTQLSKGHFALMPYEDWTAVAVQHLCSVPYMPRPFTFPRAAAEHRAKLSQRQGQLRSWQAGLLPSVFNRYTPRTLVLDALGPLTRVLSPPLRPTAAHLLTTEERRQLGDLVELLLCFGLRYVQKQADSGQYLHVLEPPLGELLCGNEVDEHGVAVASPNAPRELPNMVKQLLAFELSREVMRRARRGSGDEDAAAAAGSSGGAGAGAAPAAKPAPPASAAARAAAAGKPGGKPSAAPPAQPSERRDMFGRVVQTAPRKSSKRKDAPSSAETDEPKQLVRFKYHEGVTNAVRRAVRVQDLL
jgi:chromosome transmission fidelity protein 18